MKWEVKRLIEPLQGKRKKFRIVLIVIKYIFKLIIALCVIQYTGIHCFYKNKNGKQYVVIAAGGHWAFGSKPSDHLIAYALSD